MVKLALKCPYFLSAVIRDLHSKCVPALNVHSRISQSSKSRMLVILRVNKSWLLLRLVFSPNL